MKRVVWKALATVSLLVSAALALLLGACGLPSALLAEIHAKVTPPGSLDTSFGGGDGIVTTPIGSGSSEGARAIAIRADGKIVAAGYTANGIALVCYNIDGSLYSNFGGSGVVTTAIGLNDEAWSVAVQTDGKIVVAGSSSNGSTFDSFIARYDIYGNLDTTFGGGDGIVKPSLGGSYLALQSDGKMVVAGNSNNDFLVVRYGNTGNPDAAFGGGDGIVTTPVGGGVYVSSLALQSDGGIVVAGTLTSTGVALARYESDGTLDVTFGSGGIVTTVISGGGAHSVAIQSDGRIVVAAGSSGNAFLVVRYNADGSLDSTFGSGGQVTTRIGHATSSARSVAIQTDGKIVVAGSTVNGTNSDFAVIRYGIYGTPDPTFGVGGLATTEIGYDMDDCACAAIQRDGKIVVGGQSQNRNYDWDFAVVRYLH